MAIPHKLCGNCAFPQRLRTRKLGAIIYLLANKENYLNHILRLKRKNAVSTLTCILEIRNREREKERERVIVIVILVFVNKQGMEMKFLFPKYSNYVKVKSKNKDLGNF